jgi:hypothetical protein
MPFSSQPRFSTAPQDGEKCSLPVARMLADSLEITAPGWDNCDDQDQPNSPPLLNNGDVICDSANFSGISPDNNRPSLTDKLTP